MRRLKSLTFRRCSPNQAPRGGPGARAWRPLAQANIYAPTFDEFVAQCVNKQLGRDARHALFIEEACFARPTRR
eukprot:4644415-Prymnesium_polylepis.3